MGTRWLLIALADYPFIEAPMDRCDQREGKGIEVPARLTQPINEWDWPWRWHTEQVSYLVTIQICAPPYHWSSNG